MQILLKDQQALLTWERALETPPERSAETIFICDHCGRDIYEGMEYLTNGKITVCKECLDEDTERVLRLFWIDIHIASRE